MAIAEPIDSVQERYFELALDAGCPYEQVRNFHSANYIALDTMLPFHAAARDADKPDGPTEILLDGTRGSAKSHAVIAQVGLDDCQRAPGLKGLFLRKTVKAAGESFEDLVSKVLKGVPHTKNSARIKFPNGSKIVIGGFKDDKDIDKYLGIEYDFIVVEEGTQISGTKHILLLGSLRTSRDDWRPRKYDTTNPGGLGHSYIKKRFVLPEQESRQTFTRRFFCHYDDNPFINPEYRIYLESLEGDIAAAWRDGSWDIFAGQAFSQWRREKHVIKPFRIPDHWPKREGVDWGYAAPFVCLWGAKNPDTGRWYIYREVSQTNLTDVQQAKTIMSHRAKGEIIEYSWGDPSMWAKKNDKDDGTKTSSADEYEKAGVDLRKGDNDRLSGKRKIDRLLAPLPDGLPGIQFMETVLYMIRSLPELIYDDIRTEDVDTDGDDHPYDALKYLLSDVDSEPELPKEPAAPNPWDQMNDNRSGGFF